MADTKISALTDGSPLTSDDVFPLARSGNNYKATAQALASLLHWTPLAASLTYSSADGANTFVCSTSVDLTGIIHLGAKIRVTHASVTKYFFVTAITSSTVTLFGGTDYTLAATAITAPSYSLAKAPPGFPLDPAKWTVEAVNTGSASKGSPASGTWYGDTALSPTGPSISIPIGCWRVYYETVLDADRSAGGVVAQYATLSTSASSETDTSMSTYMQGTSWTSNHVPAHRERTLTLTSRTTYYLIIKTTTTSILSINLRGDIVPTVIRAVCAYL